MDMQLIGIFFHSTKSKIKREYPGTLPSQQLGLLFQRARDLQSLLDDANHSPLLLQDCNVKAVELEPFFVPLIAGEIPNDPNVLRTRLHQCLRQYETALVGNVTKDLTQTKPYFVEENKDNGGNAKVEVFYNERGQPFFKHRIMRGSSSFSTPDYPCQSFTSRRNSQHYHKQRNDQFRGQNRFSVL